MPGRLEDRWTRIGRAKLARRLLAAVILIPLGLFLWRGAQARAAAALVRADPETILADPALTATALPLGRATFARRCAACHGASGEADPGRGVPSLRDADRLYGEGRVADVESIVRHGIRAGDPKGWNLAAMPAYARARPYAAEPIPPLTPRGVAGWTGGLLATMLALRLFGIGLLPPLLLLGAGLFAANYLMISGHLRDAGRLRLVVTLVFGLIHGFGFAADLLNDPVPPARLAELLVGFNLGVELGQLSLVAALSGAVWLLHRRTLTLPRPIVVDVCASALVGLGMFWFIGRSFVA